MQDIGDVAITYVHRLLPSCICVYKGPECMTTYPFTLPEGFIVRPSLRRILSHFAEVPGVSLGISPKGYEVNLETTDIRERKDA